MASDSANILIGPVIGHVTSNSAIILLEVDIQVTLTCHIKKDGKKDTSATSTVTFPPKSPRVFIFYGLDEDTLFKVSIPDLTGSKVIGSFRTFKINPQKFRIAVTSCDRPKSSTGDMWPSLAKEVLNIDVLLHLGDNVYIDEEASGATGTLDKMLSDDVLFDANKVDQNIPYIKARKLLKDKEPSEWPAFKEKIIKIYRKKYRKTWSRSPKSYVLANTSNLMILDDHEVRDDFGSAPDDSDPSSKEYFLNSIAMQLYHEYQRQLWDPEILSKGESMCNEFYTIEQGPLLMTMLDARSHKAIYKHKRAAGDDSYYGQQQWNEFKQVVKKAESSGSRILLVNAALPLFFMKAKITKFLADGAPGGCCVLADDYKDFINYNEEAPYDRPIPELTELMDIIKCWKGACSNRAPSAALILSGDVHMGGFTDIFSTKSGEEGSIICRQISAGAISIKNFSKSLYAMTRAALHFTDSYDGFSYGHYRWTRNSNYSVLDFQLDDKKLKYSVALKHTGGTNRFESVIDSLNKEESWDDENSHGCNIL